jgi:lipopolysaccharide/colanic/teichoic acid biosynthesis glycosyltransferase
LRPGYRAQSPPRHAGQSLAGDVVKRLLDVTVSALGLAVGSLILVPTIVVIWLQDRRSPFYVAERAGLDGTPFRMVKLRSMIVLADQAGVMSTAADDSRITTVGRFVRRWKLDELPQLWNVLRGEMSLVGPRPQVLGEVARYTEAERSLLSVRPGMTDLSSIVFADEGDILRGSADPDRRYDQVIRPWKSRLGLLYVRRGKHVSTDLYLICLTLLNGVSRAKALSRVSRLVCQLGGADELQNVARRLEPLRESLPPGV